MSSTDSTDSSREALDRMLDALVFAPLGLLLESDKPSAELAARGRRQLEAARLLGRIALGHSSAPTDGPANPPDPQPG
ncbi:hypothetical protein [Candidatus Poriferisocius sp.]|uniref:hypothetical protein n=1 Tax=Candidatus Poriferisocius sp. TaxID=3101276 RepID=UPI003B5292C9